VQALMQVQVPWASYIRGEGAFAQSAKIRLIFLILWKCIVSDLVLPKV